MEFEQMKKLSEEEQKKLFSKISSARSKGKTTSYACVYGASPKTIARSAEVPLEQGEKLHESYWKINWAVKEIAKNCATKKALGTDWLFNPINKFWYSLRSEKDRFSTLNQGSATYLFDMWIKNIFEIRPQLTGQFHDEVILCVKKGHREQCTKLLKDAVYKVNEQLSLNRDLDVDVQYGHDYSSIH